MWQMWLMRTEAETGLIEGPSPQAVGQLFFELASAFAVGELTAQLSPALAAQGQALKAESAALMERVSTRLQIPLEDVSASSAAKAETGFGAGLVRGASAAWRWLSRSSKSLLSSAAKHGGVLVTGAFVAGGLVTAYDWLTGEEQTRRAAIAAKKEAQLALISRMPPEEVSAAFSRVADGLDEDSSSGGLSWWWLPVIGVGAFAGYQLWKGRNP